MSAFRFRAQAALDLRRRELEAAQRELAHAEQDRNTARRCVEEATAAALRSAFMKGVYFNRFIRGRHPYRELAPAPQERR